MPAQSVNQLEQLRTIGTLLCFDAAASEAIHSFECSGVPSRLLKGRTFAGWLYPGVAARPYSDCDLLVPPDGFDAAERILRTLGYECLFDDRQMPSWWHQHARSWYRARDGVTIDLHRTLPGVTAPDGTAWRVLSAYPECLALGGREVQSLSLPARALHVALHAAQHGAGWSGPICDLERALGECDERLWLRAASLARRLAAIDAFGAGLRLSETGRQLAARLNIPRTGRVSVALQATTPPPGALTIDQLARASGVRERIEIVRYKFLPPISFMRHWDSRAADKRAALVRAYLRRPAWIASHAPGAVRAWRRARRAAAADR